MKDILKALNLSEKTIDIYLACFGKGPLTFKEIQLLNSHLSQNLLEKAVNELTEQNLLVIKSSEDGRVLDHYLPITPLSAINSILKSMPIDVSSDKSALNKELRKSITEVFSKGNPLELTALFKQFQKIKDDVESDSKKIKEELTEMVDEGDKKEVSIDFLNRYEEELKNIISSQLAGIVIVLLQLKAEFQDKLKNIGITDDQWNSIKDDIKNALALETHQKSLEINDILSEEFNSIREELKELFQKSMKSQFEQKSIYLGILNFFRNHILKLDDIITKKKNDYNDGIFKLEDNLRKTVSNKLKDTFKEISDNVESIEGSLSSILKVFIDKDKFKIQDIWPVRNKAILQEELTNLLGNTKKELLIIVPEIEKYLPIEQFKLDLSNISGEDTQKSTLKKKGKQGKVSIGVAQKKEFDEKIHILMKSVNDKKGFELSHNIADIMAIVSDVNNNSVVLDKMKDWLNRLLVIRKILDQVLQFKLLEDAENWQRDYLKVKKEKAGQKPIQEIKEAEDKELTGERQITQVDIGDIYIKIISTENHRNQIVRAFHNSENYDYRKIKGNDIIALISDNSYLILGIPNRVSDDPLRQIIGIGTNNKMFIDMILPFFSEKWKVAKPRKHEQITGCFNEILTHINEYEGRKIGDLLQNVLDIAFKQKGISLDILEIKILVTKLKKINSPLDTRMKKQVTDSIEELNEKFSGLELIEAPESIKPTKIKEEIKTTLEQITTLGTPEEEIDIEKITHLFDFFLEKIEDMRGVQIGEQIQNLIDVVIKLQGYSSIVKWKNQLSSIDTLLDDAAISNFKEDFIRWKSSILKPKTPAPAPQPVITKPEPIIEKTVAEAPTGITMEQTLQDIDRIMPTDETKEVKWSQLDYVAQNLHDMKGFEISRKLQDFMDDMLETHGYSMGLKDMKQWISRFRLIRNLLEDKLKNDFIPILNGWIEQYSEKPV
jgi:hypothetical protein